MDKIGEVSLASLTLFGKTFVFNDVAFIMTYIVSAFIILLSFIAGRRLKVVPGFLQSFFELIYDFLKDITLGTLGEKDGKRHLPFIITIFIFVLFSNWIGVLPNIFAVLATGVALIQSVFDPAITVVYRSLFDVTVNFPATSWFAWLQSIPAFEEPTRSVNLDLALALLVFFAVQLYGVKNKGIVGYLRHFFDDPFPMKGWLAFFFFLNPFFYLNIIGAVANVVSHSFRLFGNIFGGGMIIVIVSTLLKYLFVPVGLFAFFGLFAGLVQAFVFTMLSVTYIQQQQ